jgi:dCMP deaminase
METKQIFEDWDQYFMSLCAMISYKSKDESTKIGAVIVGPDNEIRSTGYNSFVRNLFDNIPERQKRPVKYFYFEHAERNAIYNAARIGVSLKGCRMYTNGMPCADCTRAIIQVGIDEIIYYNNWPEFDKWEESAKHSNLMFYETSVKTRKYTGKLFPGLYFLNRNKKIY